MSQDERPGEEEGLEELYASFAALGGPLTGEEFMRLLGSDEYHGALVRQAALLLDGDAAAAEDVVQDSFAALQGARSRLGDPDKTRVYLYQLVVNRSRSVRRQRAVNDPAVNGPKAPEPAPDRPGAEPGTTGHLHREAGVGALRALPERQREVVVLHKYMGLSEGQAAAAMGISLGAARSHLSRGMSSLRRQSGPQ